MATKVVFGNKLIQEPSANSRILSGIKNPPQNLTFGNVLIIDAGNGALYGGGSGVNGTIAQGKEAIYSFDNEEDLRNHFKGGILFSLANLLFAPNGSGTPGASTVHVLKAATTTPGTLTFTFASGAQIVTRPKSEGFVANGILGDEISAVAYYTIRTAGTTGNTIIAKVNAVAIGDYTVAVSDTTTDVASGLAAAINTAQGPMGYRATSLGAKITVYAPYNVGAAGNALIPTTTVTGGVVATTSSTFGLAKQVDTVTLTGSSGTANISVNGTNYLATFATSLTVTAANFITAHAATILADEDIVVTANTGVLTFTANTAGIGQTILAPVNVTTNLAGTKAIVYDNGNGAAGVDGTKLTRGYGAELQAGVIDSTKFRISFSRGTFTGLAPDGIAWNEIVESQTQTKLLARSVEFIEVDDFLAWSANDFEFNESWEIVSTTSGIVASADLVTYASINLVTGGTETYGVDDLNDALDTIPDLDFTFILANDYETAAKSANNVRVQSWINTESRFDRFLFVGARSNQANFNNGNNSSVDVANFFNDVKVPVVHGGPRLTSRVTGSGFREFTGLHKAAQVLGRIAGLQPQVPGTFKAIKIVGEVHNMKAKERIIALDNGVLHTHYDNDVKAFCINQAINSTQNNTNLVNPDGTSYEISIERIKAQLNKEIVINARIELLGQENGPNLNTLSPADVKQWLDGYLTKKTATDTADNLIISFQNITVVQQQDTYKVTYGFVPNGPVNKLLFTGFILDANLSA